ncbi:hypothetical protein [Pikeienuella piscinae]|nr:hypothetical protein [Pikeienuella piscinae]
MKPYQCALTIFVAMTLAAVATAAERLDYAGAYQAEPGEAGFSVTGAEPAAGFVRGCPGFAPAEPAVLIAVSDPSAPAIVYGVAEGAAGLLVAGPDGVFGCAVADQLGIARLPMARALEGEIQVWPLAAEAGAALDGVVLIAEAELSLREIAGRAGLTVDPSILPPLLSEAPLDPAAEPASGRIALPAEGEAAQPMTLAGKVPADEAGQNCVGLIDQTRPDVVLTLEAPEPVLAIRATADVDTTLLVIGPDGVVSCNDDAVNYDPALVYGDAPAGDYAIWLGVYPGGEGAPATLFVGRSAPEDGGRDDTMSAAALDPAAEPAFGRLELPESGEAELDVAIIGETFASEFDDSCSGLIEPSRPDATLSLAAVEPVLWIFARSALADTTLLVSAPDGSITCNDDFDGTNAGIGLSDAQPGDYAIWVGAFGGGGGAPGALAVSREGPEIGATVDGGELRLNPFAGVEMSTAGQALDLMLGDMGLAEVLRFETREDVDPDGFTLTGVMIHDPTGERPPVGIDAIRVTHLDLVGLEANGAPERFSVTLDGIDYAALSREAAAAGAAPLPKIENPPPLSVSVSLLPPTDGAGVDNERRELKIGLGFENQIAFGLTALMLWPEGVGAMGAAGAAVLVEPEMLAMEINDMGYLRAALEGFAAETDQPPEEMIQAGLTELAAALAPLTPGSPRARLHDAIAARLGDLGRPGVIKVRLQADHPLDMETAAAALMADAPDPSLMEIEITYEPSE